MDFRIPGLPHSVVKHAQSTSVRELIQKIENHPDRHALQQDLRQNQSFNPVSPELKQVVQDVGNIELCESLETHPKTQCTACQSYLNVDIVYCTCGQFLLKETEANGGFVKYAMDFLTIPEYVIKKWRHHGHGYGKKVRSQNVILLIVWRRSARRKVPRSPWSILTRSWIPCPNDWTSSRWRSLSTMGCSLRWRSHSPVNSTRILPL